MSQSEHIKASHLTRKAIIYIRQSTPQQVLSNQESLRLQYALSERAIHLGWRKEDVVIIDDDLGLTGKTTTQRTGFQALVAQVTLGEVGIILSSDVTRLSRNCSDWYPLLDICGYKKCLIGDRDAIHDPATPNGRLLLGLKGQLSEMELYNIRARMTAGLLNKAERGELALSLPVGMERDVLGRVRRCANQEVRDRIELVFIQFMQRKTANKVVRYFNDNHLLLPRKDRYGDIVWKKPTVASILEILKKPAYAGAFVYGRSQTSYDEKGQRTVKRMPQSAWRILIKDKYEGYIDWATYEKIDAMLKDNHAAYSGKQSRGIPRDGVALLHGILYCGKCGHKLLVEYKRGAQYSCNALYQQYLEPVCQRLASQPVDQAVLQAFFEALSVTELDAYEQILAQQQAERSAVEHAQQQQLTRLQYEADLIERRYRKVDPDNRLVAAELERRWEVALRAVQKAEQALQRQIQQPIPEQLSPELKTAFAQIEQTLPTLWEEGFLSLAQQKALLRCLIDKVVVERAKPDTIQTRIVWQGGSITRMNVPCTVGSFAALSGAAEMERIIIERSQQGVFDAEIAAHLTQLGYRSPQCTDKVIVSTVRGIRLKHGIFQQHYQSHPRNFPGFLTVPQLAIRLDVKPHWLYHQIKKGAIRMTKDVQRNTYLFPDKPALLQQLTALRDGLCRQVLVQSANHPDETA